jgi:transposase InsO family protein
MKVARLYGDRLFHLGPPKTPQGTFCGSVIPGTSSRMSLLCLRLRPERRNHVWSYDFVEDRTHDGRKYRMLNVLDEFSHECLAIRVAPSSRRSM